MRKTQLGGGVCDDLIAMILCIAGFLRELFLQPGCPGIQLPKLIRLVDSGDINIFLQFCLKTISVVLICTDGTPGANALK
jgi:hypothetical protein